MMVWEVIINHELLYQEPIPLRANLLILEYITLPLICFDHNHTFHWQIQFYRMSWRPFQGMLSLPVLIPSFFLLRIIAVYGNRYVYSTSTFILTHVTMCVSHTAKNGGIYEARIWWSLVGLYCHVRADNWAITLPIGEPYSGLIVIV